MTGAIAIAGDGAPSHDTTAAIASKPGRGRTKSDAFDRDRQQRQHVVGSHDRVDQATVRRGVPVRGQHLPVQRPDEDCRRRPPRRATPGSAATTAGGPQSSIRCAASEQRSGNAEHHDERQHRERLEGDVHVVHRQAGDADEPGGQSGGHRQTRPPCQRGASSVASAKPGSRAAITTPGRVCARSCSGKPGRAQRPLSVATAKTVRAMISRSSATD